MKPVVAKIPVPTMLEMTRAVALKNPICRSKPGRGTGVMGDGIYETWIHSMMRRACGAVQGMISMALTLGLLTTGWN